VLGGASSVGKFAVQLLKALGFSVVATCSAKSSDSLKSIGADATIDYKKNQEEQIAELLSSTNGKPSRIFDAVAMNEGLVKALFPKVEGLKYFSTTNDWQVHYSFPLNYSFVHNLTSRQDTDGCL
jgi:NADPH:quinone reductase-like Zn-dependent oxidoreductase